MRLKFLRTDTRRMKRLGRKRKQKQRWRKARGRHNKIRENKKSKPRKVQIGYKKPEAERGTIRGKFPILVRNLKQAEKIEKGALAIISKVSKRKRQIIENKIREKGGEIFIRKRK